MQAFANLMLETPWLVKKNKDETRPGSCLHKRALLAHTMKILQSAIASRAKQYPLNNNSHATIMNFGLIPKAIGLQNTEA